MPKNTKQKDAPKEKEKVIEIDEEEVLIPGDKPIDPADPLEEAETADDLADSEESLDDTEINPFKDKWEE